MATRLNPIQKGDVDTRHSMSCAFLDSMANDAILNACFLLERQGHGKAGAMEPLGWDAPVQLIGFLQSTVKQHMQCDHIPE